MIHHWSVVISVKFTKLINAVVLIAGIDLTKQKMNEEGMRIEEMVSRRGEMRYMHHQKNRQDRTR